MFGDRPHPTTDASISAGATQMKPDDLLSNVQSLVRIKVGLSLVVPMIIGVLFLVCGGVVATTAAGVVGWNDHQWRAAQHAVVDAPSGGLDPSLDGALIRVAADATADAPVLDDTFSFQRADAVALVRVVETWQWVETQKTSSGSGRKSQRQAEYNREWSEKLHDSSTFLRPEGHTNPTQVPHQRKVVRGAGAQVGGLALTDEVIAALDAATPLDTVAIEERDAVSAGGLRVDTYIHLHPRPHQPEVGDQRISYRALPSSRITVLAMQEGGQLRPWSNPPAAPIMLAVRGDVSAEDLIWAERQQAFLLGGIGATVGGVIALIGCALVAVLLLAFFILFVTGRRK
jgi:hypothetical protein